MINWLLDLIDHIKFKWKLKKLSSQDPFIYDLPSESNDEKNKNKP